MESISREVDPTGLEEGKSQILGQSQNKTSQQLATANSRAKESSTEEHRIWVLGTDALMIEENGAKKGGEDVTE